LFGWSLFTKKVALSIAFKIISKSREIERKASDEMITLERKMRMSLFLSHSGK